MKKIFIGILVAIMVIGVTIPANMSLAQENKNNEIVSEEELLGVQPTY